MMRWYKMGMEKEETEPMLLRGLSQAGVLGKNCILAE